MESKKALSAGDYAFDASDIERRKALARDLWAGRPVDHIPIWLTVQPPSAPYSMRHFAEAGEGLVSVSLLDMAGGLNVALDLLWVAAQLTPRPLHPEWADCVHMGSLSGAKRTRCRVA